MNKKSVLITGGAGFIGSNCARHFLDRGWDVTVFDNLFRSGSEKNLAWLRDGGGQFEYVKGDLRDARGLEDLLKRKKHRLILHLAAQVAVTTSIQNPREDYEINALGTFNLLEAMRLHDAGAFMIYASTNKVYGKMESVGVRENAGRYEYASHPLGIPETFPLDFYSPYGCSKGAADQYAIDYARIFGLRTCVMRQSCIYGYRQFGNEDQGWVAWFMIAALLRKPVTIYGDGKQVRDVLFVDDLIEAYEQALEKQDAAAGRVYNIGGGIKNTLSLLELVQFLESSGGRKIERAFDAWRAGDQKVYVSDIRQAAADLGWAPRTSVEQGLRQLGEWVERNRKLFAV